MANEINVRASILIRKGNLSYSTPSDRAGFTANQIGVSGPTPGYLLVPLAGVAVDLSKLVAPGGWAQIYNQDPAGNTNFLQIGAFDPDTNEFYPTMELLPGESFLCRLSRYLGSEFGPHTGTGPTGSGVKLYLKAVGSPVGARVDAFDA